jgi:hypothetical protein
MQPETKAPALPAVLAATALAMDAFIVTPYSCVHSTVQYMCRDAVQLYERALDTAEAVLQSEGKQKSMSERQRSERKTA